MNPKKHNVCVFCWIEWKEGNKKTKIKPGTKRNVVRTTCCLCGVTTWADYRIPTEEGHSCYD